MIAKAANADRAIAIRGWVAEEYPRDKVVCSVVFGFIGLVFGCGLETITGKLMDAHFGAGTPRSAVRLLP
jgi:hypothetical protein